MKKFGGYKTEVKERTEARERPALRKKVKKEKHLAILREFKSKEIRMKTCFCGPMNCAKTLKQRFRVRGPGPARKKRYTSSWVEEEEGAQSFPCGDADEGIAHIVRECERYKEGRNVLDARYGRGEPRFFFKIPQFGSLRHTSPKN